MIPEPALNWCYIIGTLYIFYRLYKRFWVGDGVLSNSPGVKVDTRIPRKNVAVAYLLLLSGGGYFGAHHVYLGNYACSLLYAWTVGLCGLGPMFDFCTLWYQVRSANARNRATGEVDAKATHIVVKALCRWLPLAAITTFIWWLLFFAFIPTLLDRVGVVDIYAARAGLDRNPFDVLEIPRYSSFETAKKNFRTLSLKYHPDRNPNCADCASKMSDLNTAYDSIKRVDDPSRPTDFFDNCMQDWNAVFEYFSRLGQDDTDARKSTKKDKHAKKNKGKHKERRAASTFFEDVLEKVIRAREKYHEDEL